MSILRGPNLRNQVAFFAQAPRKLRASKKMHPVGSEERDPMFHRLIILTKILDKEGSQNIARVAVVQLRLRIRLTEKSPRKCTVAGKLKP